METAAETLAPPVVPAGDLSGGVKARILLYLSALILMLGFGTLLLLGAALLARRAL